MSTQEQIQPSILFTREDSVYKQLGVDCWDRIRDARLYIGSNPVVCHPPCRAWGQLSHMAKPRPDEKQLAIFSINKIREVGGVLEHPRSSKLWKHMSLPMPGVIDEYGGFSIIVSQFNWGHKAEKKTLLYICGCKIEDLPQIPDRIGEPMYTVASRIKKHHGNRIKKEITKKEREATPVEFARYLIKIAKLCKVK